MPRLIGTPSEIQTSLAQLEETPRCIVACTFELSEARLSQRPASRDWSAIEILAHLRACADLWTHSIYAMLVTENPHLPDFDERRWAQAARYTNLGFHASLQAYSLERQRLLGVLRELSPDDWNRTALIGERAHSVFSQARRMAKHEAEHCAQMKALFNGPGSPPE
jgi:uncharacterized damage-inducible protein DinB